MTSSSPSPSVEAAVGASATVQESALALLDTASETLSLLSETDATRQAELGEKQERFIETLAHVRAELNARITRLRDPLPVEGVATTTTTAATTAATAQPPRRQER